MTALVEQHLTRLAEDGRSPVTLATYRFAVGKLQKFIGGVWVGEASPARIDAAFRSMRTAHGPTMTRQAKTILRGALQLAVMANVLGSEPVRDVQPLRSKAQPKGAVGLTAEQLRDLLEKASEIKVLPRPRSRRPHHVADRDWPSTVRAGRQLRPAVG
jgi:hypothetical protein